MNESSSLIHGVWIVIHESRFLFQINCLDYVIMENVIEISLICINFEARNVLIPKLTMPHNYAHESTVELLFFWAKILRLIGFRGL